MSLVTIYYNDVVVTKQPYEIYKNCRYVNIPIDDAVDYAENKIQNGEWYAYCIPEILSHNYRYLSEDLEGLASELTHYDTIEEKIERLNEEKAFMSVEDYNEMLQAIKDK